MLRPYWMDLYFSLSSKNNYFQLVMRFIFLKAVLKGRSRSPSCACKLPKYNFFLQKKNRETHQWGARGLFWPPLIQRKELFHGLISEVLLLCELRIWALWFSCLILFLSANGPVLRNLSIILWIVASDDVVDGDFWQIFRPHCSHDARVAQVLPMYTAQHYIFQTLTEPLSVRDTK